jgi:hypothetical protein
MDRYTYDEDDNEALGIERIEPIMRSPNLSQIPEYTAWIKYGIRIEIPDGNIDDNSPWEEGWMITPNYFQWTPSPTPRPPPPLPPISAQRRLLNYLLQEEGSQQTRPELKPIEDWYIPNSDLEEALLCRVCLQVPSASSSPIYQCQNGHHWCITCHNQLPHPITCPVCREKFVGGRCLIVQKILEENIEKKYKDQIKCLKEKLKNSESQIKFLQMQYCHILNENGFPKTEKK